MIKENQKIARYHAGIDIGSTTAKLAVLDRNGGLLFSRYKRHQAKPIETIHEILEQAVEVMGDIDFDLKITGSAGMGVAESFDIPFVQEVVSSAHLIEQKFPNVRTFIELGGEDSKIIFFDDHFSPDIRMNGSCAGGTGAFIDQMAVLLDIDVKELNELAGRSNNIYPIASRCGVFAKTDIQALLSHHVSKEDIAASVFHSVALQVITSLAHGRSIENKILFGGGPLTFYLNLRKAFINLLKIDEDKDCLIPKHSELIPAMGAAMIKGEQEFVIKISKLLSMTKHGIPLSLKDGTKRLKPLFNNQTEFEIWKQRHDNIKVPRIDFKDMASVAYRTESSRSPNIKLSQPSDAELTQPSNTELNKSAAAESNSFCPDFFLGIDSGSTTTKIVIVDDKGTLVSGWYGANNGDPIKAVKKGLDEIKKEFQGYGFSPDISRTCATGYGEGLIKAAFALDDGVVETMAHYRAARYFEPDVSFIFDIGGQDMKAIYIRDHAVSEIQVNEACSSGCGSFIETFARSLGYSVEDFAEIACRKNSPFDLGTRCTVFMNSRVKQALREGAAISDISAGLAFSVIKNALYKVLKLKDIDTLGDKILVQGGTFKNPAVLRALELLLGREVIRPDIPELMGAYGAALTAWSNYKAVDSQQNKNAVSSTSILETMEGSDFSTKEISCKGCENQCRVLKLTFSNGNSFYTGNRCERHFSNNAVPEFKGKDLIKKQIKLLFDRNLEPENDPVATYGIPRCLNMYANFPFWAAFLTEIGFRVVLSSESNFKLYEKGTSTVMSENICFPAKLVHGHIFDLAEKKVDRIFYPIVVYEKQEYENVVDSFNCPVVTGYPNLIKNAVDPEKKFNIPIDTPAVSFKNSNLLRDQLYLFFKQFKLDYKTISRGVEKGIAAQKAYTSDIKNMMEKLLRDMDVTPHGGTTIVLAGRPYHMDSLVNHGIPDLLTTLGVNVVSEYAVSLMENQVSLDDLNVLTQWSYTNRLYAAAKWTGKMDNFEFVQLTSFGCGPDAISTDEVRDIIRRHGKIYTLIKMDEIANLGAVKIRLRSMLEALKENAGRYQQMNPGANYDVNCNLKQDSQLITNMQKSPQKKKILIAPFFSPFYSPLLPHAFKPLGYRLDVLPPQDSESLEIGLKTINNDMCYPAVLVAGDIAKAFKSGKYDPHETAIILTQTGGQCRASSYVSLIKKGLFDAGFDEVPVITISNDEVSSHAGFKIDKKALVKRLALGIIFADPLAQMYLSTHVKEKNKGNSAALHKKYLDKMSKGVEDADFHYLLNLLKEAVTEFNEIEIENPVVPKIGLVGEIFVKYNIFANGNIVEWLSGQGVEVILPPLQSFFAQHFINETYDQNALFKHSFADRIKYNLLEIYSKYYIGRIEKVMQKFRFYRKCHDLRKLSEITGEVVSLANQAGEGWLLTAEMIALLEGGINNIVCLQPFGCISNHITGRGMENKLRELFPNLNLLALDMDAGASEVNILNRLHFMVIGARDNIMEGQEEDENFEVMKLGSRLKSSVMHLNIPKLWSRDMYRLNGYVPLEVEKWRAWVSNLDLWEKARNIKNKIGR